MARPRLISDQQLLQAARDTFVEQGFSATTASIAKRAGVSEGTLFKRFATKEELFSAALGLSEYGVWRGELLSQAGLGEVQTNLERAAAQMLVEAARLMPNLLAVFSRGFDPQHNPALVKSGNPAHLDRQALADYLHAEISLSRVRPLDTDITALTIIGALTHYFQQENMLPVRDAPPLDASRFVRGLFDVLWPGLKP